MPLRIPEHGLQKIPEASYTACGPGHCRQFWRKGQNGPKREEKTEFGVVAIQQGAKQHLTGASAMMMGTFKSQAWTGAVPTTQSTHIH